MHVSMVGFDGGAERERVLDGQAVNTIHANLTAAADTTQAVPLSENYDLAFMGDTKGAAFEITEEVALSMLYQPNPHGRPNSDVIVPWGNGHSVSRRPGNMFIIDFGTRMSEAEASNYEAPFEHVRRVVWPKKKDNNREAYRKFWWRHTEARQGMVAAISKIRRFIGTIRHSKHRIFAWLESPSCPDSALIVFAREDDYFFGVLHSRIHEVWALAQGTQVREKESGFRYTPTSCFETFPFPSPTHEQSEAIATAARTLDELRVNWLNPAEWTREEVLEFPGSAEGPWARFVHDLDSRGVGIVRYPRLVPRDEKTAKELAKRTRTTLYNQQPTWLVNAHRRLNEAVFAAYGWEVSASDEEILERLLRLNAERSGG